MVGCRAWGLEESFAHQGPHILKGLGAGKWGHGTHSEKEMWRWSRGCGRDKHPARVGVERSKRGWGHSREDTQLVQAEGQEEGSLPASNACEKHTLLEASMNLTPLYVMDKMMVGIFFMCSVDFYRE